MSFCVQNIIYTLLHNVNVFADTFSGNRNVDKLHSFPSARLGVEHALQNVTLASNL